MSTATANRIKWTRIAPGEYIAKPSPNHTFTISHREIPDAGDGYGRRDDWVVALTGIDYDGARVNDYPLDPDPTYKDAKDAAQSWWQLITEG